MRFGRAFQLMFLAATTWYGFALAADPVFQGIDIFPPGEKHSHASCVVETASGDLLATWYIGSGERSADDVKIEGARLRKGQALWGPRFDMADTPGYPDCNPAIFAAPDKTIWLWYPTIIDHRWESAVLKFAVAKEEKTVLGPPAWIKEGVLHITPVGFEKEMSAAIDTLRKSEFGERLKSRLDQAEARSKDLLYQRLGWMPRVHPTALPSGRWILPLYCDTFSISIMAITDDRGATWHASKPLIGFGNIQPSIVRRNDGSLVAYMRDNGPYRKIRVSESRDEGETWSPVQSSSLPNPGAGIEAIRLASGNWVMIYNDSASGRHTLAVSLSEDEGKTWKLTRHVALGPAQGPGRYHYPSIMQASNGMIHSTFTQTSAAGKNIRHAYFNEEWIRGGERSPTAE